MLGLSAADFAPLDVPCKLSSSSSSLSFSSSLSLRAAAACLCRKNKKASDGNRAPDTKYIHGDDVAEEEEEVILLMKY
jgi:hypothetical protein